LGSPKEGAVANVTKAQLVSDVAAAAGVSKVDAEKVVSSFFDLLISSAKRGDKVAWPGFGSFRTTRRAARTGRNPRTGAAVKVPATTAMKFTSSSTLKASLNSRGSAAKKATAKKTTAKKSTAKKSTAKKTTAKKATAARKR
jgi:DNA-binding protein HU-beta